MIAQTPSKIFKFDFRIWNETENTVVTKLLNNEVHSGKLIQVTEVVLDENAEYKIFCEDQQSVILFPLYGEVIINDYYETLAAGESLTINPKTTKELIIKNHLAGDKSDVLIFEFKRTANPPEVFIKNSLNFDDHNKLIPISNALEIPNFIGIYDSRNEGLHTLKKGNNTIFGMVIQGAFEFQNRLMETRDAILLWELKELEFEALAPDALILFIEI